MKLDEAEIAELANKAIDHNGDELARLLIQMINIEHKSRHHSRPKVVKLLIETLDSMDGE